MKERKRESGTIEQNLPVSEGNFLASLAGAGVQVDSAPLLGS